MRLDLIFSMRDIYIKSPKTKTLADGLIEITSSMLDETESKTSLNAEEGEQSRKNK